jgi:hypothetical protein
VIPALASAVAPFACPYCRRGDLVVES